MYFGQPIIALALINDCKKYFGRNENNWPLSRRPMPIITYHGWPEAGASYITRGARRESSNTVAHDWGVLPPI